MIHCSALHIAAAGVIKWPLGEFLFLPTFVIDADVNRSLSGTFFDLRL